MKARSRADEASTKRSNRDSSHARPGDANFAVLIVGVENLAELNRRHGYEATDEVIATVGRRLGANVRSIDEVAHYAGGKFAVLLSAGSAEQLAMAAPRLARRVNAELFETAVGAVRASIRIGAALAPRHGRNACRLVQRAEEAYEQAAGEADRYALYAPGQALERGPTPGSRDRRRNRFRAQPAPNRARLPTRGRDQGVGRARS